MIELNLLPDVKLEYIKTERTRALVLSTAILISVASIGLLVLLIIVGGLQKKHISDLNDDIKSNIVKLQKQKDIEKILTVQNQLNSLTDLHSKKPAAANLFTFLNEVTPNQASIENLTIDFTAQTVTISGTANSLSTVNKYADTLKYTKYSVGDSNDVAPAFKDVVLTSFSLNTTQKSNGSASYSITFTYDPTIFDATKDVNLVVPTLTTTRNISGSPQAELFTPAQSNQGGN